MNNTSPSPLFSIIVPAFNEEAGIDQIINRIFSIQPDLKKIGIDDLELIVVDDGSLDTTSQKVNSCQGVKLLIHSTNRGYGAALKTGFSAGRGELLGFLDADGTYPPEFFPDLCKAALDGAELVVGSRRSGANSQMPFSRRIGNLIWSNLVSLISGNKILDPASGMRVFHANLLERLYPLPDGLNFTPVMSMRAVHEGIRLVEVPIPYRERLGRSKLNIFRDGLRFLQTILWTAMYYNPVQILGGFGAALCLLSGMIALILIFMRISGTTSLGPIGVAGAFLMVVLGIAGVNLFALGVVFNYLVSLFHKQPVRQGLFGRPVFKSPLENHFWWLGLIGILMGLVLCFVSFLLALEHWPIERLWLYLLAGTMFILVGIQLVIFWIIVSILDELNKREILIQNDMQHG